MAQPMGRPRNTLPPLSIKEPGWIIHAGIPNGALRGISRGHPSGPNVLIPQAESLAADIAVVGVAPRAQNDRPSIGDKGAGLAATHGKA
jgi:hypothetical protein